MLIRLLVLLAAANLAWFFWAHSERGGTPQSEPERLAQQMHPEAVRLHEAPPEKSATVPPPLTDRTVAVDAFMSQTAPPATDRSNSQLFDVPWR